MPPKSIKMLLLDSLEDLSAENFDKFRYALLDRREEPRVRRCRVEGKSRLEVVDVLVSTFTEEKAVGVTEEILREIRCIQEADRLAVPQSFFSAALQHQHPGRLLSVDPMTSDPSCSFPGRVLQMQSTLHHLDGREMAPKTAKKILKEVLENLTKINFDKFRSELVDRGEVKMNQVEDRDFLVVSDVMVSVYTQKQALLVAHEILTEIRCGEAASNLVEEAKKAGLWSSDGSAGDEEHFVDKHMDELIQRVSSVAPILDKLLKFKVIQIETYDEISAERTSQAKMRAIYRGPLRAGRDVKDKFLDILKEQQRPLIDDLMKK
ncbi:apoptosis-associated speck-like protein containing a CARD [Cyprinodon tularosa]|uniref:apoptosis-associated speck-like protein containing a CARD n=1 Tax=Cyprinodon tularosa TaxID=77115 RepID=UPI0018E24592|nr:apoptosis-associated speck-like protein containing a CARD [Cyprinodon tularosa]